MISGRVNHVQFPVEIDISYLVSAPTQSEKYIEMFLKQGLTLDQHDAMKSTIPFALGMAILAVMKTNGSPKQGEIVIKFSHATDPAEMYLIQERHNERSRQ